MPSGQPALACQPGLPMVSMLPYTALCLSIPLSVLIWFGRDLDWCLYDDQVHDCIMV